MTDPDDHQLLIRVDERLIALQRSTDAGFRRVDEQLAAADKAIDLARDNYPTQKDIAVQLESGRRDAHEVARREATILFEKVEVRMNEQAKLLGALSEQVREGNGAAEGTRRVISLALAALGAAGVIFGIISSLD